ncbi:Metal-dependent hydrolase, endonuclease/exonuclease/phosphatase family [Pedococcus dokdonensis]|uniref:Metal-dependent hydrolase, endonuclease/exonuclease/phosphatase family n=1 Tax=Pedococcus dokdonensis TaxID=443156 RepID=A0A1H0TMQ0_9MICO|nr:endonuclease/exonuclease/phosphatase family protein [Pedococcus dokdonensis]SDP55317.1 Metal-dependent hydrolase, endonuclease/exonuclease/phosphatase family [Pedococcus dokdonensis]
MRLTLLSYNIHSGVGLDGVLDLGRVADVIGASGADVVGLQEVDRHRREQSGFEDQPGFLAERLGMHLAYAANLDAEPAHPGAPRAQYGTALLSRLPFASSQNTLLPCFEGSEQRGLLDATVVVGDGALRVLGTHLQHDSETERTRQAEAVVAALDDRPTVLLGDLNTTPGAPAHACLASRLDDAWALVGEGEGHTFAAELPPRRIDYVWVGGGVRAVSAQVLPSVASDHSALRVEVEL